MTSSSRRSLDAPIPVIADARRQSQEAPIPVSSEFHRQSTDSPFPVFDTSDAVHHLNAQDELFLPQADSSLSSVVIQQAHPSNIQQRSGLPPRGSQGLARTSQGGTGLYAAQYMRSSPSSQQSPPVPPKVPDTSQAHVQRPAHIPSQSSQGRIPRKPVGPTTVLSALPSQSDKPELAASLATPHSSASAPSAANTDQDRSSQKRTEIPRGIVDSDEHQKTELEQLDDIKDAPPPYSVEPAEQPSDTSRASAITHPTPYHDPIGSKEVSLENTSLEEGNNSPLLITAVKGNDHELVVTLLCQGVNIDEVDTLTQCSAVMEAARLGRREVSKTLIGAGARLHLRDQNGCTALHLAAEKGDPLICTYLLSSGAQVGDYDGNSRTALQVAAESSHGEAARVILEKMPAMEKGDLAYTKAFLATVKLGDVSLAQSFIEKGLKPKKLKEAWKPIVYAAQSGNVLMLDFITNAKCNIKSRSPDGWTALHFAAKYGKTSMVERLLALKVSCNAQTSQTKETALHLAVIAGQRQTALTLMSHKDADIKLKDVDGQEPLHHAARLGDLDILRALFVHGAKAKSQNKFGWKPVHIAAAYGHAPTLAELITRGYSVEEKLESPSLKPNKKTNDAVRKGYWAEARWPHSGARPLHLAIEFGRTELAKLLISAGARFDEPDEKRWRPLHYAAFHCQPQIVEMLLRRGASAHSVTDDSNTPIMLGFREFGLEATNTERERVVALLEAAMNAQRKTTLQQLSDFRLGGVSDRRVKDRNQAWQTAEMASMLQQHSSIEEGELDPNIPPEVERQEEDTLERSQSQTDSTYSDVDASFR